MSLPLLNYIPSSQNQRVEGYEVPGEEQIKPTPGMMNSEEDVEAVIWAAYRQIFSEHQMLASNRQRFLESQLRYGQISVRDFICGLLTSDPFRRYNYEPNSNYRFVELCVQRALGRDVYNQQEKIAWSIVVGTKGINGFVEDLLNSEEYLNNFGEDTVPYQRRRVLPQKDEGEMPFNLKTPRYGAYHRQQLGFPQIVWQNQVRRFTPQEKQPKAGDPTAYLNVARSLSSAKGNALPKVSAMNIDYDKKVPYRKVG